MNPEDQPKTPPLGAPTAGPTDAEYQDMAFKQRQALTAAQAADPKPKPAPAPKPETSKLSQFVDYMKKGLSKQESLGQIIPEAAQGAARGVVDAGMWTADKLNRAAAATGVLDTTPQKDPNIIDKWMGASLESKPMTAPEEDALLGQRHEGVSNFVEGAVQMGVGAVAALALAPEASLAAFPIATKAVLGGVGVAVATDPYVKRMSSMLSNAPAYISTPVNAFLAADPKDPLPEALAKSSLENVMTFFAIDKTFAVLGVARAKLTGGDVPAAEAKLAAVKHDPATQGPTITAPTADGQFAVVDNSKPASVDPVVPAVERRTTPRANDYASMTASQMESAHYDLTNQIHTKAQIAHDALVRGEEPVVQLKRTEIIDRMQAEADALQKLIDGKTVATFPTAAQAEGVAASTNEAALNQRQPISLYLQSPEQLKALTDAGDQAMRDAGMNPSDYPDLNLNYSESPEEGLKTIEAIRSRLSAPKVVQTHAQTQAMAEDLIDGKTGEQIIQLMHEKGIATKDFPQHIVAARLYMNSLGQKIKALSEAADTNPDNGVAFNSLNTAMRQLVRMHRTATGLISDSGRALDANKMIIGKGPVPDAALGGAVADPAVGAAEAKAAQGMMETVYDMEKPDMLALARQIRMANGDPNAILQLMRAQSEAAKVRPTFAEKMDAAATPLAKAGVAAEAAMQRVNGVRVEAMLSGPKTQIKYIVSHTIAALQMPTEMWWGGVLSGNTAMRQQGADQLAGLFLHIQESWAGARRALNAGSSILDPQGSIMLDAGGTNPTGPMSVLTTAAHLPSRALTTTAEFYKQISYRSSLRAQSLRLARADGITDPALLAERVADDMKAAFTLDGKALNPKALDWARIATFQNPLEYGIGKAVQEFVQANPAARLVMPFVRTPVNLDRYAWQRFPLLGAFQRQMREDIAAGGERRALAVAKQSMGAATWAGTAALVYNKLITGGGPSNPEAMRQWRAAGHEPYSIRVPGGGWVSYKDVNPSLSAVGIVADAIQTSGEMKAGEIQEVAAAFGAGIARSLTNKSFMQGMADALDAASNSTAGKVMRFARAEAGSFVPNVINQVNPDHTLREVRGMMDEIKSRVPGFSTTLEPRRNILGEPIMKPPGEFNDALNPFTFMGPVSNSSVQEQLVQLGKGMAMPPEMHGNLKLTDREIFDNGTHQSPYDRMLQLETERHNGTYTLRERLTHVMEGSTWQNAGSGNELYPGGKRYVMASQIISEYQQKAWKQVQKEYPKLKDAVQGSQHDKVNAIRNPAAPPWRRPQFLPQ